MLLVAFAVLPKARGGLHHPHGVEWATAHESLHVRRTQCCSESSARVSDRVDACQVRIRISAVAAVFTPRCSRAAIAVVNVLLFSLLKRNFQHGRG